MHINGNTKKTTTELWKLQKFEILYDYSQAFTLNLVSKYNISVIYVIPYFATCFCNSAILHFTTKSHDLILHISVSLSFSIMAGSALDVL